MTERHLFRLVAGKQTGPYPPEKLRPLIEDGRISRLDRFSYDGVDWLPADHFPALMTSGSLPSTPSVATSVSSTTPAPAATAPDHADLAAGASPPPFVSPLPKTAAARGTPLWRRVLIAGIGIAILGILAASTLFLRNSVFTASRDVTDQFGAIVDSVDGFNGSLVVARGIYYSKGLLPRVTGHDSTIKFCSGDTDNVLVTGDCAYRLTLVAPEAMAAKLKDIIGRLEAEQPSAVTFTCSEDQSHGRKRPIGRVTRIQFFHEAPQSANERSFLAITEDGEIEED
jgi:hypothetical protein